MRSDVVTKFRLQVLTGQARGAERFDFVSVAVGHFSHPRTTSIVGFTGAQIHSHSWEGPIGCVGKKVLLVGAGHSATDIAAILIKFGVGSLHISIRNDETFDYWEDLPETGFCEVGNST